MNCVVERFIIQYLYHSFGLSFAKSLKLDSESETDGKDGEDMLWLCRRGWREELLWYAGKDGGELLRGV